MYICIVGNADFACRNERFINYMNDFFNEIIDEVYFFKCKKELKKFIDNLDKDINDYCVKKIKED